MAKFPEPPTSEALGSIRPVTTTLAAGSMLVRIFFAGGPHPSAWNRFRHFGPTASRFDHHEPDERGAPQVQSRGILYAANGESAVRTALAEVFQSSRTIDRDASAPVLAGFVTTAPVVLLDLKGEFATTLGASSAIHSGPRPRARRWARALYDAYPSIDGLHYCSSMYGNAPAIALFERAADRLADRPVVHRELRDPALTGVVVETAARIRYRIA